MSLKIFLILKKSVKKINRLIKKIKNTFKSPKSVRVYLDYV
jgi:hypothetical protein